MRHGSLGIADTLDAKVKPDAYSITGGSYAARPVAQNESIRPQASEGLKESHFRGDLSTLAVRECGEQRLGQGSCLPVLWLHRCGATGSGGCGLCDGEREPAQ